MTTIGRSQDPRSLFERLGGSAAVDAAVEDFYRRVLADPRINRFFLGVNMDGQRQKQKAFLTMLFGGPAHYVGKDMRSAHARLGLGDEHFNAVAEHLIATLRGLGVAEPLVAEVGALAERARRDVLNR